MKESTSRRVPDEKAATPDEIRLAIEALTEADSERLDKFAKNRLRKLGPVTREMTEGELLNEAIASLLDGSRRWNREKVNLTGFLIGAMRSITNNLARKYDPQEQPVLQSDLARSNAMGEELPTVFDTTPAPGFGPEQALLAAAEQARSLKLLSQIEHLLAEDLGALSVVDGWRAEMTGPEIMQALGFTETEFNTTVRRIRRKIQAKGLTIEGERYVQ